MSFEELQQRIIQWAMDRQIIHNSTAMAQSIKTHEELGELISALYRNDLDETIDAYGDVLVTIIISAHLANVDLLGCLSVAYDAIKDRKGTLRADGVFVKEADR
jgi:NTP pyrophosphatase (non-canonical NTP hydrolase)